MNNAYFFCSVLCFILLLLFLFYDGESKQKKIMSKKKVYRYNYVHVLVQLHSSTCSTWLFANNNKKMRENTKYGQPHHKKEHKRLPQSFHSLIYRLFLLHSIQNTKESIARINCKVS